VNETMSVIFIVKKVDNHDEVFDFKKKKGRYDVWCIHSRLPNKYSLDSFHYYDIISNKTFRILQQLVLGTYYLSW